MKLRRPASDQLLTSWRTLWLTAIQGASLVRALGTDRLRPPSETVREGRRRVQGLHAPIEILRDRFGVSHCFAQTPDDALFAQGYVHVLDRYWEMDFYRRVGQGRLAEVAGPLALPADRLMRAAGLHRAAHAAWEDTPLTLQNRLAPYIRGVNAAMAVAPLPVEVRILNYRPDPWQAEDSVTVSKLLAFMLSPAWEAQALRARIMETSGLDALRAVDPGYPPSGPASVPPGAPYAALTEEIVAAQADIAAHVGFGAGGAGSNNWAIAPSRTASGRALLACDPHLSATSPSMTHVVHLDCPEFGVAGAGVPGLPGVIWGLNRRIAWGPTAGMADTQDLFVEEADAEGRCYRGPDGWETPQEIEERILVRGFPAHVQRVRITRRGPIVSPELLGIRQALSLRSAVLDGAHSGSGLLDLFSAANVDEFRHAISGFHDYCLMFAYADVDGHIGLQLSGDIPRRRAGSGWLPAAAWDPAAAWGPYLSQAEMPQTFDPPGGYVWSANNVPVPAHDLPFVGEFLDGYRAARIGERLQATSDHSPATARVLQVDRVSLPMRRVRDHLLRVEAVGGVEMALMEQLRAWDGVMAPESVPAAVVGTTHARLLDRLLTAKLGQAAAVFLGGAHAVPNVNVIAARAGSLLVRLLDERPASWFADDGNGEADWQAALARAFREALGLLRDRFGADPARWQWGMCHPLVLKHGLGDSPAIARLFNHGPIPFGGDANTVFQAGLIGTDPFTPATAVPAFRMIVDMQDPPQAEFALSGGQDGHLGSRHHADLLDDWLHGRTLPLHMDRSRVEADSEAHLILEPEPREGAR